jgi:tetratricopeptide (TPR) repeat protein
VPSSSPETESETLQRLRRAVADAPRDAALRIRCAQTLLQSGRRQESLAVALQIIGVPAASAELHDALGTLFTHLEEPARALPHFLWAVEAAPDNIGFRYNLAMAQRMAGHLEAAERNLDAVIGALPLDGEAWLLRSDLRRQSPDRNHVADLEKVLSRLKGRRAALPVAFALAKELDDLGEYARSFSCLQAACRSMRSTLRYDVADDIAVLERLRATHTRQAIDVLLSDCDNEECVFIVGLPRSGTTLVERILGSHSQVYAAGELDAFARTLVAAVQNQGAAAVSKLDFVERALQVGVADLGTSYVAATRPRTGHTLRFTDKQPINYLYAGLIRAALPRARFIALHRDPMDSCYAMYKTLFASAYPFSYDLIDLGRYYVAWRLLMQHWAEIIGDAWLPVGYEDLVTDLEGVGRRMIAHCGLEWEPQCLEFHAQPAAVTTASAAQVHRPLYADSIGKWRRYAAELEPLVRHFAAHGLAL